VEELVDCVALQVGADFFANLTFDWFIFAGIALATMLLELVGCGRDNGSADGTKVRIDLQQSMDVRDVRVVGLNFAE